MQSKRNSLIEILTNIGSGLLISTFIVQPLVFPIFGVYTTVSQNFILASIFTTISIIRGYFFRRIFNFYTTKAYLRETKK